MLLELHPAHRVFASEVSAPHPHTAELGVKRAFCGAQMSVQLPVPSEASRTAPHTAPRPPTQLPPAAFLPVFTLKDRICLGLAFSFMRLVPESDCFVCCFNSWCLTGNT